MGTIPLYNDGQMPRVPEAEGLSAVPQARYQADYERLGLLAAKAHEQPEMPKEVLDVQGRLDAAEAWAGAVESVGGLVSDLAKKVGQVRDAGALADGENQMRKSFETYQSAVDPSSDVATRLSGWLKQSQAVAKQILGSGRLSSKAKESMQLRMERFNADAVIHLSADASKQAVAQARGSFAALEQSALEQGDYEGALTANEGMTEAELQSPEEGAARAGQLMRARQKQELYAFIEQNPRVARDLFEQEGTLGYYDLTPWGREEGRKVARATFARHEYETVRGLKESIAGDEVRDVDGLDAYALDMDDDTMGQWVAYVNGEREMDDPVDYERGHLEVSGYNALLDPHGEKLAKLQTSLATRFNGGYEERLLKALEGQAERTRVMGTNAMDDELVAVQRQITQSLETGMFGEWQAPGVEVEVERDAKAGAAQIAGNIRASVMAGMKEGRYATPAAMREEFGALMHPHVVRSLQRLLPTHGAMVA